MEWSKQTLLGLAFFVGGSVMLYTLVQQINPDETQTALVNPPMEQGGAISNSNVNNYNDNMATGNTPTTLTADVETEQRILAQKHEERMARVAEQERRTREFLVEQERAEALALQKAREENERYRSNSAVEPIPEADGLEERVAQGTEEVVDDNLQVAGQTKTPSATKPVVVPRPAVVAPNQEAAQQSDVSQTDANNENAAIIATESTTQAPSAAFNYTVQRGDGIIKLARRYHVPADALVLANAHIDPNSLQVGEVLEIPSRRQIARLLREQANNTNNTNNANPANNDRVSNTAETPQANSPPSRPTTYTVARGDGLIKLARQYNMPVAALAEANSMGLNQNLRVGQRIVIPSSSQIARLQREATAREQQKQALADAEQRLRQARQTSSSSNSERFGVQVALADNQDRADEVASRLRRAGYSVSTSPTDRGVRVIVGPERGREAAGALRDKINADNNVDVNGAWVLRWR